MQISRFTRFSLFVLLMLAIPASSFAGVFVSVTVAPPVLPLYVQPACPGDGYIWTPGYWAYGPDGYYWVPGTWVVAPEPGFLWTPGYWGWGEGVYLWHPGYWGPHIGFYGGVNYGFGYFGVGYVGGYWSGRTFYYNRTVNNINITNVHIYNKTVVNNVTVNRVSYNGGEGGVRMRPSHAEEMAGREHHFEPTGMQMEHERGAGKNREFLASVNHGRPSIAATARPAEFHGREVVAAKPVGEPYRPENRGAGNHGGDNRAMNRGGDNRAMNRDVPRPQNSERGSKESMDRPQNPRGFEQKSGRNQDSRRNMDRPMPHENSRNDRAGRPDYNAPKPENRGPVASRPSAYHPQDTSRPNNRPQENAPRQQNEDKGHGKKDR